MNYYVLKSIEFGPTVLERILKQLPEEKFDERPDPDRFTLREAVAHLADWEPIWCMRMEKILAQPGVFIQGVDEGDLAIKNDYAHQDVWVSLGRYKAGRAKTTTLIHSLKPEDWSKKCEREGYGEMVLEDWANLIVCHDMYHLEHASAYLAKG